MGAVDREGVRPQKSTGGNKGIKITFFGSPCTKKNSQQIIIAGKRPCIIQSKAYRQYEKSIKEQLAYQTSLPAIDGPVEVTAHYYLSTVRIPDLCNLMAATHDVLEHCGVIANDKQIKSVDGSRIKGVDRENPRVEIWIRNFDEDNNGK